MAACALALCAFFCAASSVFCVAKKPVISGGLRADMEAVTLTSKGSCVYFKTYFRTLFAPPPLPPRAWLDAPSPGT